MSTPDLGRLTHPPLTTQSSITRLPNEVLAEIASQIDDHHDFFNFRLTCRVLKDLAEPLFLSRFFREKVISLTFHGIIQLRQTTRCPELAQTVQSVTLVIAVPESLNCAYPDLATSFERHTETMDTAYSVDSRDVAELAHCFDKLPNLRRVALCTAPPPREPQGVQQWRMRPGREGLVLPTNRYHLGYSLDTALGALLTALSTSKATPEEFVISTGTIRNVVPFIDVAEELTYLRFGSVKILTLELDGTLEESTRHREREEEGYGKFLFLFPNVEQLVLDLVDSKDFIFGSATTTNQLKAVLNTGLTFPKLRRLRLGKDGWNPESFFKFVLQTEESLEHIEMLMAPEFEHLYRGIADTLKHDLPRTSWRARRNGDESMILALASKGGKPDGTPSDRRTEAFKVEKAYDQRQLFHDKVVEDEKREEEEERRSRRVKQEVAKRKAEWRPSWPKRMEEVNKILLKEKKARKAREEAQADLDRFEFACEQGYWSNFF